MYFDSDWKDLSSNEKRALLFSQEKPQKYKNSKFPGKTEEMVV